MSDDNSEVGIIKIGIVEKAVLYRTVIFIIDITLLWILTGNLGITLGYPIVMLVVSTIMYILFDLIFIEEKRII